MKTIKLSYSKILVASSLFMVLFSACAQSQNSETPSQITAPQMDIQTAVLSGNLEAVKQHIAAGTDLNQKDPMTGSTPLITAATFNRVQIAQALIEGGTDLSLKNNDGTTALHSAAFFGRIEIVKLLIEAKADKSLLNNFGATPRQTVMGDFAEIKPIYEMMQLQLGPLGLQLDLAEVEAARPVVAMMLQ